MNPEDNNPLSNPFATGGMNGSQDLTPGLGGMTMSDNLASAQDSLTAAGMAASQNNNGVMGLDQIVATDPNATTLPPVEEPLVPAAPVPGSIGSAVSVPPADPVATPIPGFGDIPNASNPIPGSSSMTTPETSSTSATASAFNPFATADSAATPLATSSPTSTSTSTPTATMPTAGSGPLAQSATMSTHASAPQPAPAPMPMGMNDKAKHGLNPLVMMLAVVSIVLLILTIVFFIKWQEEKKNQKVVYVPQTSEENSDSAIKILSCRRSETREEPSGSGTSEITISYTEDDLSAYSSKLLLSFSNADDANAMRESNVGIAESTANLVGGSLVVDNSADGNNYIYSISSQDGTEVAASDVRNVIYGTVEGDPSLAMADVQAKYEAEGYVCVEE